jgi:hypothetical protein
MHVVCTPYLNAFGGSAEVQINTPTMIYMLIGSYVPTHKGVKPSPENGQSLINKDSSNPNLSTKFESNVAIRI